MHLSVKLFIWHSFLCSTKVMFVVGQGQWGITKRKECEGYSIRRTKAVSKVMSCYCWDFVWWKRKERQDMVNGWCGESQYQTASAGKFFFREARKLQNICFQEKEALFFSFLNDSLSFGGEQCHRLWFITVVFANWSKSPCIFKNQTKMLFFFFKFVWRGASNSTLYPTRSDWVHRLHFKPITSAAQA